MKRYCFIDASNLFYGGEKSLGWKIDYKKLIRYIKEKYRVKKVFYYGGVELNGFPYSVLDKKPLNLKKLLKYLNKKKSVSEKIIKKIKFYLKLNSFGYTLKLKPVKIFKDVNNNIIKKANCDVDMTFDLMFYFNKYSSVLILSGDGDFTTVLKYLISIDKEVIILARGERTAKELKQLVKGNFKDFSRLKNVLEFIKK